MSESKAEIRIDLVKEPDIEEIICLLESKIRWLEAHGIRQWVNGYTQRYNKEYFIQRIHSGNNCYAARAAGKIVGIVMLEKESKYFSQTTAGETGYYIKHFASVQKGVGRLLLEHAYKVSIEDGKDSIYTNCSSRNQRLVSYFKENGFSVTGKGIDNSYHYYLLEKKF